MCIFYYEEDLAKGGRFWINMFARRDPLTVKRPCLVAFAVHIPARVKSVYLGPISVVLRPLRQT